MFIVPKLLGSVVDENIPGKKKPVATCLLHTNLIS